jgi:hypothetical protein
MSKEITIELPKDMKLREQNPECSKGNSPHLCALWNNQLVCLVPNYKEGEEYTTLFDILPCKFNPKKAIEVET